MSKVKQETIPEITLPTETPEARVAERIQEVVREIATVVIEVPLCRNPPARGYTSPPFVAVHLTKSKTAEGRHTMHNVHWGLKETGAKLANGRPVRDRNDVLIWLLDQIGAAENI